jgi:glutamine amidotransferase
MKNCLILDYGVGNIGSIRSFFRSRDYEVSFGFAEKQIADSDLLILPGVGSFQEASRNLDFYRMKESVKKRHTAGKPILGICLGLQIMTESSEESPNSEGLGIIPGPTRRLYDSSRVGWDSIDFKENNPFEDEFFYFNHSYAIYETNGNRFFADSKTGGYRAIIVEDNSVGVQFHPEKSQKSGAIFLNWAERIVWGRND